MKIFSWNVNGMRAALRKGALAKFLEEKQPDVVCFQEIKSKKDQVEVDFEDYEEVWNPAERAGYAGTAIFVKKGIDFSVRETAGFECKDAYGDPMTEGRILVVEFEKFFLVNVYTPNSKPDLSRLELREKVWDPGFLKMLEEMRREKPVVTCGDFNAAHEEIDIARPKTNHHSAGFTDEERKGVSNLVGAGFLDSFRLLHPDEVRYTWWSHWGNARANNVGWRIDYFFVASELSYALRSAEIFEDVLGSDHCPVAIELEV